jgi:hypothetical protein
LLSSRAQLKEGERVDVKELTTTQLKESTLAANLRGLEARNQVLNGVE